MEAVRSYRVEVGTEVATIPVSPSSGNHPTELTIKNDSEVTVFVGDSTVSIETGFPIDPHQNLSVTIHTPNSIYAVAPDDCTIYVLES